MTTQLIQIDVTVIMFETSIEMLASVLNERAGFLAGPSFTL